MEARSLRFAATARALGEAARRAGYVAPAFRSPPRVSGRMRTIRRHANGTATVSLVVKSRPWNAVVADMIEGFVTVNAAPGCTEVEADGASATERLRDLLWAVVEEVDVTETPQPPTPLRVLDKAA